MTGCLWIKLKIMLLTRPELTLPLLVIQYGFKNETKLHFFPVWIMLSSALIYSPLLFVWSLKMGGDIRTLKSWICFHLAALYLTNYRKFEIFYRVENFFLIWFQRQFVTKQCNYLMNLNSPLGLLLTWLNHVLFSLVRTPLTLLQLYRFIWSSK